MINVGVTNRNFIRFLRAGAFGIVDDETEPMSKYKWEKLFETADVHKVADILIKGAEIHSADRWFNYDGALPELNDESESTLPIPETVTAPVRFSLFRE